MDHNRSGVPTTRHEHRRSRRKGGTHPDRISLMRNVETPMGSAHSSGSRPTVRKAQIPSGRRKDREANAGSAERQGETITRRIGSKWLDSKGCADVPSSRPAIGVLSGSVSDPLGRPPRLKPRPHKLGGLGLHERKHRAIGGDEQIDLRTIRKGERCLCNPP